MWLRDPGRQHPRLSQDDTKGKREEDPVLEIWSLGPNLEVSYVSVHIPLFRTSHLSPLSTQRTGKCHFPQSPRRITKWFVKSIAFSWPSCFLFETKCLLILNFPTMFMKKKMLLPITDSRFLRSSGFFPSWEDWPHALCLWVWWVDWQASLSDKQAGNLFSGSHCPFQLTVPFLRKTCFAASCHRCVLYKYIWSERRLWPRSHWKYNSQPTVLGSFSCSVFL